MGRTAKRKGLCRGQHDRPSANRSLGTDPPCGREEKCRILLCGGTGVAPPRAVEESHPRVYPTRCVHTRCVEIVGGPRGRGGAPPRRLSLPGYQLLCTAQPRDRVGWLKLFCKFSKKSPRCAPSRGGVHAERNTQSAQPTITIESVAAAGPAAGPGLSSQLGRAYFQNR